MKIQCVHNEENANVSFVFDSHTFPKQHSPFFIVMLVLGTFIFLPEHSLPPLYLQNIADTDVDI